MERRDFLRTSGLGMFATAPSISLTPQGGDFVSARDFGATGNGNTDDTASLQAAIDAALARAVNLTIPPGTYKITRPLLVGGAYGSGETINGWTLRGAGPGDTNSAGGTTIVLYGTEANAIMQIGSQCYRRCRFEDFTLICASPRSAAHGLYFASTEFSNHIVSRVTVKNSPSQEFGPSVAFAINAGTGANGEFILFESCAGFGIDTFFQSNAPQAYVQSFIHCQATVNSGGSYFKMLSSGGGSAGGLNIFDFNGTSTQSNGISNTTLLNLQAHTTSVLNLIGGRLEHITQLFCNQGGSPAGAINMVIQGMQIIVDFDPLNAHLALPQANYFVVGGGTGDHDVIESCQFYADASATCAMDISWAAQWANLIFRDCTFTNFGSATPRIHTTDYAQANSIHFENCKQCVLGPTGARYYRADKFIDLVQIGVGQRRYASLSGTAATGRPANRLAIPQVTAANGTTVVPESPWLMKGNGRVIGAYDWNSEHTRSRSSSPFAKGIVLPGNTTLYQDLTAIPLDSKGGWIVDGTNTNIVFYQALVTKLGGDAGAIQLTDSVTGMIYDQFSWTGNSSIIFPFLLTIGAVIEKRLKSSYPRLSLVNLGKEAVTIEFAFQFVTDDPQGTFAPSESVISYGEEWGIATESALVWSRLALPHKSDDFGSAARTPLSNLSSDLYLSSTDERLTYFANGSWWKAPRSTYGTAAPIAGMWTLGDVVFNSDPAEAGISGGKHITIGWICTATGSPGTWSPMNTLTGH